MEAKYPIGTQYYTRGKHPRLCTVRDVWKTYNSAGELVATRYVADHEAMGQTVTEYHIVETMIAMGVVK